LSSLPAALFREQHSRSTGCDHAAVDLGDFEARIDRRIDNDQVTVAGQTVDEGTKVWKGHGRLSISDL